MKATKETTVDLDDDDIKRAIEHWAESCAGLQGAVVHETSIAVTDDSDMRFSAKVVFLQKISNQPPE